MFTNNYSKSYQNSQVSLNPNFVRDQLALLGYQKGDTVYLRAFYPKGDPRGGGVNGQAKNLNQLIKLANNYQAQGRGVYLVVNGGGQKDENVTICRAIFYEHDNLEKDISRELWRTLGLPEPTFQVDTGGKSIHSYWVFVEPIDDKARWKQLQSDLLEHADADKSLKNPSRVMRLAGCWHFSANNQQNGQSTIVANSGKRYSFEELRAAIPEQKKITRSYSPTISDDVPLQEYLRPIERGWIADGVGEGQRNSTGYELACNLIGTAARLPQLNPPERFSGDPRQLFDDYCARCNPPLDEREADLIWRSAEGDNPTPTLSDDVLKNNGYHWRRRNGQVVAGTGNVVAMPPSSPPKQLCGVRQSDITAP
ncbi:MAG: hypothetical protein C6Y22_08240, partial [Hapalosiphonaceae cyanobacterium JJU2]